MSFDEKKNDIDMNSYGKIVKSELINGFNFSGSA